MSCGESGESESEAFESNVSPWADCVDCEGDLGVVDHVERVDKNLVLWLLELQFIYVGYNYLGD